MVFYYYCPKNFYRTVIFLLWIMNDRSGRKGSYCSFLNDKNMSGLATETAMGRLLWR